jgi:hypothetical protein
MRGALPPASRHPSPKFSTIRQTGPPRGVTLRQNAPQFGKGPPAPAPHRSPTFSTIRQTALQHTTIPIALIWENVRPQFGPGQRCCGLQPLAAAPPPLHAMLLALARLLIGSAPAVAAGKASERTKASAGGRASVARLLAEFSYPLCSSVRTTVPLDKLEG